MSRRKLLSHGEWSPKDKPGSRMFSLLLKGACELWALLPSLLCCCAQLYV